jgi:hypothetical protein
LLYTKISSKWIKNLHVRPESLKLLQEKIEETLIGIGNCFLNRTPIAQEIRLRIDKWYCTKLKSSAHQRKKLPE